MKLPVGKMAYCILFCVASSPNERTSHLGCKRKRGPIVKLNDLCPWNQVMLSLSAGSFKTKAHVPMMSCSSLLLQCFQQHIYKVQQLNWNLTWIHDNFRNYSYDNGIVIFFFFFNKKSLYLLEFYTNCLWMISPGGESGHMDAQG